MKYFEKDFINFFKELSNNNNKEWFHSQKKRYETSVKKPFYHFLNDLINAIQKYDESIQVEPKNCVGRINRDIRFSKDKPPYNLHYTAFISSVGKKDKSIPGIYLRFSPEMLGIMCGCYGLDKQQLVNIRAKLTTDGKSFRKLLGSKKFADKFGLVRGEKMKRVPKEWQVAAEKEPLILNKQFYFVAEREAKLITSDSLLDEVMDYWKAARPVNDFLLNSIKQ